MTKDVMVREATAAQIERFEARIARADTWVAKREATAEQVARFEARIAVRPRPNKKEV
jgi:predicted component of type VI protein secretion system